MIFWIIGTFILLILLLIVGLILHLVMIGKGLERIQRFSFQNVYADKNDFVSILANGRKHRFLTTFLFSGVYTITKNEEDLFEHQLSCKHQLGIKMIGMNSFLLCFSILTQQLKKSRIKIEQDDENQESKKDPFFTIQESELGTMHLVFKLTESDHNAFNDYLNKRQQIQ